MLELKCRRCLAKGGMEKKKGVFAQAPFFRMFFCTLSDRMQRVQAMIIRGFPSCITRTRWRFGIQRRLVKLCAWLILCPTSGPFPHISHRCDMIFLLKYPLFLCVSLYKRIGKKAIKIIVRFKIMRYIRALGIGIWGSEFMPCA